MTADSRRRLGAITALVLGVFVGLTLLPFELTGPVGRWIGHGLWHALGAGALGLPLLGLGLALAGFERLGRLDMKRAALLMVGLSLLVPYLVSVVTRVSYLDLVPDVDERTLPARLAGLLPGMLAEIVSDRVGVAGAVLLGFLALSALTLLTFAWHPLQRLEAGREPGEKRAGLAGSDKSGKRAGAPPKGGAVSDSAADPGESAKAVTAGAGGPSQGRRRAQTGPGEGRSRQTGYCDR